MSTKKSPKKKQFKRRRTINKPVLTKLDYWAISASEVYAACLNAGMSTEIALAFAMDKSSYPDWIVSPDDPLKNPLDDYDEDDD